jgi:hypothetical protein
MQDKSGAKGNESAISEGLKSKETVKVKDMNKPHDKSQRMPKGSDRA